MSFANPYFFTGFEWGIDPLSASGNGLLSNIGGTTANFECTAVPRTGAYSLRSWGSATTAYGGWLLGASGYPIAVMSIYVRFQTSLPTANCRLIRLTCAAGLAACIWYNSSDSKLYVGFGTALTQASISTVTTGTWYRIDLIYDATSNPHTLDWKIDGTDQTGITYAQAASYQQYVYLGVQDTCTFDVIYDDWAYSRTASDFPIGEVKVVALRPNSDGTHNNAANTMEDASGNDIDGSTYYAYTQIDEGTWTTSEANYIRQATIGTARYVEVNFSDWDSGTYGNARAVIAYLQYNGGGTSTNQGGCVVRSNTTETTVWGNESSRADYSETSMFYKRALVSPDGGSWSTSKVDALIARMGYSGDVTPNPYWRAFLLEVAGQAAGTTYKDVSGTISSGNLAGALNKKTSRSIAGVMSLIGEHGLLGTLAKKTIRSFSGIVASRGDLIKQTKRTLTGLLDEVQGELDNFRLYRALSGAISLMRGDLWKHTLRNLAGNIQSTDLYGTLAGIKLIARSISGAISPSGELSRTLTLYRSFTGALTSTGELIKQTYRSLAGAITPSGALSAIRAIMRTLEGSIAPSGVVIKQAYRSLAGAISPSGSLIRNIRRLISGAISPSGALIKLTIKALQGVITSSGLLIRRTARNIAGVLTPVGSLIRDISRLISGAISPAATLISELFQGGIVYGTKILRLAPRSFNLALDSTRPFILRLTKLFTRKYSLRLAIRSVILRLPRIRR